MSGGSMDYLYCRVEEARIAPTTSLRRAFIAHLKLVAKALHDIEYVDSGDSEAGSEEDAILACLVPEAELDQIVQEAQTLYQNLGAALKKQKVH